MNPKNWDANEIVLSRGTHMIPKPRNDVILKPHKKGDNSKKDDEYPQ
jgi:hypothetical protein